MDTRQRDWENIIEGIGLENVVQQWEAHPTASKAIEWRTKAVQGPGRRTRAPADAAEEGDEAEVDADEDNDRLIDPESEPKDDFALFHESHQENNTGTEEDLTPWDGSRHECRGTGR
jgi:hypothetical protein